LALKTGLPGVEIMKRDSKNAVTARTAAVIAVLLAIVAFGSWGIQAGTGMAVSGF
jgi:hypothetical protein